MQLMVAAAHPPFLSFPAELQIKILLQLDNRSLIRCRSVCRDLRALISSEVALQYRVELAKAGMIEDPLGSAPLSLSERLEKVRAYRAAWETPTIVFDTRFPQRPDRLSLLPMTGGVLPFVTAPHAVNFWKPGSSLRGVPEARRWLSTAPLQNVRYSSISVDLEQDLVVLTTEMWHPGAPSAHEYRVHLFTTACAPHPLAALLEPLGLGECVRWPWMATIRSTTEIFGDLVAWSANTDPGQILVWNWKTGDVLLRITPYAHESCFKFLDDSHLVVLFDQDLRIYDFSASSGIPGPPAPPPTIDTCPCVVLWLPPFAHEAVHSLDPRLYMQSTPSSHQTAPLFHHDPAQKIVCLALKLLSTDHNLAIEHYIFVMPISALLSQFRLQRASAPASASASAPATCDVPWEHWGPQSCRVFRTPQLDSGSIGVSGTKVVMSARSRWPWESGSGSESGSGGARVVVRVIDVNPFAVAGAGAGAGAKVDPRPGSNRGRAAPPSLGLGLADPGEGGYIADCQMFRGECVRSGLPYTMAAPELELELELEAGAEPVRNDGHELVVFEDRWVLLYMQRSPTRFTATGVHTMRI